MSRHTVIFGRVASGEKLTEIHLRDRVEIRREGSPVFPDALRFSGVLHAHLCQTAHWKGSGRDGADRLCLDRR